MAQLRSALTKLRADGETQEIVCVRIAGQKVGEGQGVPLACSSMAVCERGFM